MPFVRMPEIARAIDMPLGREPDWWSTWTHQPGSPDTLHAIVRGGAALSEEQSEYLISERTRIEAALAVMVANQTTRSARVSGGQTHSGVVRLRDYQIACCDAVQDAWATGAKAPLVVMPTASGKTLIASELIARTYESTGGKALFLAHRKELLDQTAAKVRLISPKTRVGMVRGSTDEIGREVTIASVQTIGQKNGKRLAKLLDAGPYALCVADEAHHFASPMNLRILKALRERNPDILVAGMTATPAREDGLALDTVFDRVAFERNIFEMIRDGWLVPPRIFSVPIDVKLDQVKTEGGEYVTAQLGKVMNTPQVNRAVVQAWMQHGHDRKMLVFAVDVAHTKALAQEFRDHGYTATHVDGAMKDKDRQKALDGFREGSIKLLVHCAVLTEGYDDPSVEGILWARPTQSQGLCIQGLGRGLRLFPGKTECIVIDCVGNSEKHPPVQLASLVGFDPLRKNGGGAGFEHNEDDDVIITNDPTVDTATLGAGREILIGQRVATARYKWRETSLGWVLHIPRIGYYLVVWHDKHHHAATIRFYDQRSGRKNEPPREVVREPISFELAYGLVESECDRIFRASERRKDTFDDEEDAPMVSFVDLDEGVDEDVRPPEDWMLKDASWRTKSMTPRQKQLLISLGVKEKSMPEFAGEASDLITIMRVERDVKMRLPATEKQLGYFVRWNLAIPAELTKGAAAKRIYEHRIASGFQEARR